MNLSRMRDIDAADPIGTLGPRVTPAPTPAPAPVRRTDGFIVSPEGKLSTDLPDPTVTANPPPTTPDAAVCAREHLKVGDRVLWLKSGEVFVVTHVNSMGANTKYRDEAIGDKNPICWHEREGVVWERV